MRPKHDDILLAAMLTIIGIIMMWLAADIMNELVLGQVRLWSEVDNMRSKASSLVRRS